MEKQIRLAITKKLTELNVGMRFLQTQLQNISLASSKTEVILMEHIEGKTTLEVMEKKLSVVRKETLDNLYFPHEFLKEYGMERMLEILSKAIRKKS